MQQDLRQQWLDSGWKRGAFVDIKGHQALLDVLPEPLRDFVESTGNVYVFPILYDCALVDERFAMEPWAQVLLCWPCELDNNCRHGKNPRRYHFPILVDNNETFFEVNASSFFQISRQEFLKAVPTESVQWPENELNKLLNWVAERYRQPTFPDEWNKRLSTVSKLLNKVWKDDVFSESCSGVYFRILPFKDTPDDESYSLSVFITVPDSLQGRALRDFNKSGGNAIVQKLYSAINLAKGIEIKALDTISESAFTKKMEREYVRWQLEYYTYKNNENDSAIPAELEYRFEGEK